MIKITEVGPRDGLQNQSGVVPTGVKVAFVNALSRTGVDEIEVSSFVSRERIPQLADAAEVFARMDRIPGILYSALVPNERALDQALLAGVNQIAVFTAASEAFTQRNVNASITGTLARFDPVLRRAGRLKLPARGYVSTAFWCPFEGRMAPEKVLDVSRRLLDLGVETLAVADTVGKATPEDVRQLMESLLTLVAPERLALHFHDTFGRAVENVIEAWRIGITRFDASAGGLGGCPYAPGARGNVSTEEVAGALRAAGAEVRVDVDRVRAAVEVVDRYLSA